MLIGPAARADSRVAIWRLVACMARAERSGVFLRTGEDLDIDIRARVMPGQGTCEPGGSVEHPPDLAIGE